MPSTLGNANKCCCCCCCCSSRDDFGAKLVASHHGMATFDKTGEEWVQKENGKTCLCDVFLFMGMNELCFPNNA